MRQIVVTLLVLAASCWHIGAWAKPAIYSAAVPVDSQSADDRKAALQRALTQVLIKASGDLAAPNNQRVAKALPDASRYVQQFRYLEPSEAQRTAGIDQLIDATFDRGLVQQLLKDSGIGVWPDNRPDVLIWAIEDTPEGGRQVITDKDHPLIIGIVERAQQRGLSVILPLWDLDDQLQLSDDDLWRLSAKAIVDASARYDVNTVLAARYSQTTSGRWNATWQLHHMNEISTYEHATAQVGELATAAIDPMVSTLAQRYIVQSATDEDEMLQTIVVQGVQDYAAYKLVLAYINGHPMMSGAKLVEVKRTALVFQVLLSASWSQLNDALALDRAMKSLDAQLEPWQLANLGGPGSPARYVWQGYR